MSYADAYQSPQPLPSKPARHVFQYQQMFTFVFENPNWMTNLLWGSLCVLVAGIIPIVPYMVLFGYQFELIEALHRRRGQSYPDFDTNRLGDYLGRGVWPLLAGMLVSLVLMFMIVMPIFAVGFFSSMALLGSDYPVLGVIAMLLVWAVFLMAMVAMNIVMVPIMLRAGLSQDFGQAFNLNWIKSFVSLVWKEILLGGLFLALGNFVATIIGVALFCVGVYPAMTVVMLAQAHFMWQLYEIFLDRGGEPIPLRFVVPAPIPVGPR